MFTIFHVYTSLWAASNPIHAYRFQSFCHYTLSPRKKEHCKSSIRVFVAKLSMMTTDTDLEVELQAYGAVVESKAIAYHHTVTPNDMDLSNLFRPRKFKSHCRILTKAIVYILFDLETSLL